MSSHVVLYNDDNHSYKLDGEAIRSVTQVLSSVGYKNKDGKWRSVSGSEFISGEVAGIFGTEFHKVAYCKSHKIECEYDLAMQPWVNGLDEFLQKNKLTPLTDHDGNTLSEVPIASVMYKYGMTPDFPCVDNNYKLWIVDWKTSVSWMEHWWLQLGAYSAGLREWYKIRQHVGTWIVRFKEDGYEDRKHSPSKVAVDFNKFNSINNVLKMAA